MIPWVREKFAERRAKWLAARSKRSNAKSEEDDDSSTTTSEVAPRFHRLQDNPEDSEESVSLTVPNSPRLQHSSHHHQHRNHHQHPHPHSPASTNTRSSSRHSTSSASGLPRHHTRQASAHNHHQHQHHQHNRQHQNASPPLLQSQQPCHHASRSLHSSPVKLAKVKGSRRSSESTALATTVDESARSSLTSKDRITVRVICPSARVLSFQTDWVKRLAELKHEIILELSDDLTTMPLFAPDARTLANKFRLLKADYQGLELNESLTLHQLGIANNDSLILMAKRTHLQQMLTKTRETRTPKQIEIEVATSGLTVHTCDLPMVDINEIFQQSNLQFDVRKVIISLAQASAVIIGSGPYATSLIEMLKQKLINKRNYQNETLQCLVDMGFKKERAEYALKLHNNVYSTALEWLIQRQSEEAAIEEAVMSIPRTSSITSPSGILTNDSPVENVAALLEIVRIYSYRDIPPTTDAVKTLVNMGFQEPDVIQALKKTCNNKAAACEWLCGNRTGSLVELREGLAQDSPILKTILELPQVQLNLANPKILLAFLAIMENEHNIRLWGGDNDTTSIITHILQKYHEEKHVSGINQFYSNR